MADDKETQQSSEAVDFPLVSINDKNGNDTLLIIRTDDVRNIPKDDTLCPICYYNSEEDEDVEQERKVTRKTLYDTKRYGLMCISKAGTSDVIPVCSHKFHTTCLYQLVKVSRDFKCPFCRATPLEAYTKLSSVPELYPI